MKRYLLTLTLFLCPAFCLGQGVNVQGDLIKAPDSVPSGRTFVARIKGDLPYRISSGVVEFEAVDRRDGDLVLLITAADKPITISVSHQIAHPTAEEIETAPLDDKKKFLEEWLPQHNRDEIYQDSHTVKVGDGPGPDPPGPDPGPDPPDDPLSRKVYEAAIKNKLPAEECQTVAANIRAEIGKAVATSVTLDEIQKAIKERNKPVTKDSPAWDAWEKTLPGLFTVTNKKEAIDAYNKIADGLGAVK